MNIKDDFILKEINEGYLVGGSIRDLFTKKCELCDRDISIKGAEKFAKKIANQFDATFITLDSENQIFRVVLKDKINYLDISELQGKTIEDDLKRRDFTINAIAYDLAQDKFIDVTGGLQDLKNGILRHIDDKNFEEDPLRILRAFRFYAVTGFEMTDELQIALKKYMPLALKPAKERINYEIMKLFGGNFASKSLLKMDEFRLLEDIFPCVKDMKKVPPNTHHHLDLFHHVVETVAQIENLYANLSGFEKEHMDAVDFGGFPRINHLKLAGFLHDIGKYKIPNAFEPASTLSNIDTEKLKTHTIIGHNILKEMNLPDRICNVALQHHEHNDGTGYPHGLSSDWISIESQIVNVCNSYDNFAFNKTGYVVKNNRDVLRLMLSIGTKNFSAEILYTFAHMFSYNDTMNFSDMASYSA